MPASISKPPLVIALLTSWCLICSGQAPPQTYTQQEMDQLANLSPGSAGVRSIDLGYEGVRGTPYLSAEWLIGRVRFRTKDEFSTRMLLNINLEKNTLHFQLTDGTPGAFDPQTVDIIKFENIGGDSAVYTVYSGFEVMGNGDQKPKFFHVLWDGSQRLLKFERKYMRKADYKGAYNSGVRYDEYLSLYVYYLQDEQGNFHKVKLKKKSILGALQSQSSRIQQLLKEYKFDLTEEEGVTSLMRKLSKDR